MRMNLYKYHTNPKQLVGYGSAFDVVPDLVWHKYFPSKEAFIRTVGNEEEVKDFVRNLLDNKEDLFTIVNSPDLAMKLFFIFSFDKALLPKEVIEKAINTISQSPKSSYLFAWYMTSGNTTAFRTVNKYLLDDNRFPMGEPAILESPQYSYMYAQRVLNRRWPRGEKTIAKSPMYSLLYAQYINDRFELGEPTMREDANTWARYKEFLDRLRFSPENDYWDTHQ